MKPELADSGRVAVIGGGFTGLSAALRLSERGVPVTVFEADDGVGGLAGSFQVGGTRLEKFYHHWFTNDRYVMELIRRLGREAEIVHRPTTTGSYYANSIFRLSTPFDVLKYRPLSFLGRIRLGLLVLKARRVKDWRALEDVTAADWIRELAGQEVFDKVWWPLLQGKFGRHAGEISAVWFWNKLVLRGGSRGRGGEEVLAYYRGGFAALADEMAGRIRKNGGEVLLNTPVDRLVVEDGVLRGVEAGGEHHAVRHAICTTPLPVYARLVRGHVPDDHVDRVERIRYLGNTCLTLVLDRSLSSTYWLNIADPDFPFVGVIEHTNFEPPETYGGKHIVYLSKYLPTDEPLYRMSAEETLEFAIPHIQKLFPEFDRAWIVDHHLYKAEYSQPLVELRYSELVPESKTPVQGLFLSTMAQIYPEDRGTNYAIREGEKVADELWELLAPAPASTAP